MENTILFFYFCCYLDQILISSIDIFLFPVISLEERVLSQGVMLVEWPALFNLPYYPTGFI